MSLDVGTLHGLTVAAAQRAHASEQTAADYACSLAESLLRERFSGTTNNAAVPLLLGYFAHRQDAEESRQIMRDVRRELGHA